MTGRYFPGLERVSGAELRHVSFDVPGLVATKGSHKAFMRPGMKFPVVVDDNPHEKDYRARVALAASTAMHGAPMLDGPLELYVAVFLPRPKGHFGARGLKPAAPLHPTVKPDSDKILRSVQDALEHIVYEHDAAIVSATVRKCYVFGTQKPQTAIIVRQVG